MTEEQRKERLNYHMYTTCETPAEHAERIVKLEELCGDLERARRALCDHYTDSLGVDCKDCPANSVCSTNPVGRMDELGVPRGQ